MKEQILSMIQTWSMAFRKEPKYKVVQDTFNLMRMEGKGPNHLGYNFQGAVLCDITVVCCQPVTVTVDVSVMDRSTVDYLYM